MQVILSLFTILLVLHNAASLRHQPMARRPLSSSQRLRSSTTNDCIVDAKQLQDSRGNQILSIGVPRVIAGDGDNPWAMWFQYRDSSIDSSVMKISTGRIGFMTSPDGLSNWSLHPDSPVLSPSKENGDWFYFDSEHVGLGDVIQAGSQIQARFNMDSNAYLMYIYGGNGEIQSLGGKDVKGSKMEIGVSVSIDGVNWSRIEGPNAYGSILEVGKGDNDFDSLFVGWPTVLEVNGKYRMYYHSFDAKVNIFVIAIASSSDGLRWTKEGITFTGSNSQTFDEKGASRRHVVKMPDNTYRMYYEAISLGNEHSIGLATSKDGVKWTPSSSDQPIFSKSSDALAFDGGGVSSPHVIYLPEANKWRLYYVGHRANKEEELASNGIGVAESIDGLVFNRIEL